MNNLAPISRHQVQEGTKGDDERNIVNSKFVIDTA